ncbi:MAG: prepilin-type N-terminal cleavage/methylation domain-containing protein [Tissierellaceae bacterium]|nr:prepilin-type N-terminal cleavage/methylation domain-containing protein [Tissierellaceae bacterium]
MLSSKRICRKNKGFTLIEVILVLALSSLIMLPLLSILDFSIKASTSGNEKDELILNGRYAIEYIKDEIRSADVIMPSNKIKGIENEYRNIIGFILVIKEDKNTDKFVTYHAKGGEIIRIVNTAKKGTLPPYNTFTGNNAICEYVHSIDETFLDLENKIIHLDFCLKTDSEEKLRLQSDIFIRVPIDY